MLYSILFYSILFYSILFYSILFYSILFYSILAKPRLAWLYLAEPNLIYNPSLENDCTFILRE